MIQTALTVSDLKIIAQALEEYETSEYAGEVDINRAKIAIGRVRPHLSYMEDHGYKITEMKCHEPV